MLVTAGDLVALDADDGSKRWEADVGHSHDAPPAVTSDTAYVAAWNGGPDTDRGVAAVDLEGSLRWRAITDVDVSSAPTLADGVVYVGGSLNSEAVVALDATDGSERWRVRVGQYATTPAVADGTAYVGGGSEHAAYALEAATGGGRWRVETDGRVWGAPTVVDDIVYVGSRGGTVYALEPADGETQWIASVGDDVHESIAATDERLYVPTADGLVALDTDGTEAWSLDGRSRVNAPSVVGDVVVVTDHSTAICLGEDGQRRWTYEFDERVIDDMVFGDPDTLSFPMVSSTWRHTAATSPHSADDRVLTESRDCARSRCLCGTRPRERRSLPVSNADHPIGRDADDQRRRDLSTGDSRAGGVADDLHQIRGRVIDLDASFVTGLVDEFGNVVEVRPLWDADADGCPERFGERDRLAGLLDVLASARLDRGRSPGRSRVRRRCLPGRCRARVTRVPAPVCGSVCSSRRRNRSP